LSVKRDRLAPVRLAHPGRGHRPCHCAAPGSGPAGGPKPPAGARPAPGGRFAPAGPGAGLCFSRTCRSTGHRPTRAGETRCVSCSRPMRRSCALRDARSLWQGPLPLPKRYAGIRTGRGPKAPGQRPPRPWRVLRPRRVGRWPLSLPDVPIYRAPFRAGGGNAGRVSCSRPERRMDLHRFNGRGHRPCHSATLASGRAGGLKPPASARPAPGGCFAPAGSGAGLCPSRTCRSTGHCPERVGETRVAFPGPARTGECSFTFPPEQTTAPSPPQWQGPSPLPRCYAVITPAGGQSPRRALASAPPPRRACRSPSRAGGAFPAPARRDHPRPQSGTSVPSRIWPECCFSSLPSGQGGETAFRDGIPRLWNKPAHHS